MKENSRRKSMKRHDNGFLCFFYIEISSNWLSFLIQISFLIKQSWVRNSRIIFLTEFSLIATCFSICHFIHERKAHATPFLKWREWQTTKKNNSPSFWHFHVARLVHSISHCYLFFLENFTLCFVSIEFAENSVFHFLTENSFIVREKIVKNWLWIWQIFFFLLVLTKPNNSSFKLTPFVHFRNEIREEWNEKWNSN